MLVFVVLVGILNFVDGAVKCPNTGGTFDGGNLSSIFSFGEPVMFVTSYSQRYDPYSLVDIHRKSSALEEYLMVGYSRNHSHRSGINDTDLALEYLRMVVYDGVKAENARASKTPDLVLQNLEKEFYWRYYNSTGIFPSMTIVNTSTQVTIQFHSNKYNGEDRNDITFKAFLSTRNLFNEPQIPLIAVFEVPANSRVLRKVTTLIQYQSYSLWRWKLSNTIMNGFDLLGQSSPISPFTSSFKRIDNPCVKDLFLIHVSRTSNAGKEKVAYLASPLIQSHLNESWFYDMKTTDHPWWPDAPEKVVLTNDHLAVLTLNSMWISDSLNDSRNKDIDMEMSGTYEDRPILTYTQVNPCEKFGDTIDCFVSNATSNTRNISISTYERLFYTPVCYLYQFPNYDDLLIFTVERNTTYSGDELITDFTVIYSPSPYVDWRVLFSNVVYYKVFTHSQEGKNHVTMHVVIKKIVGIFFNHHLRQFDITLELNSTKPKYVRFVLPEVSNIFDGYGDILSKLDRVKAHASNDYRKKLRQLNGTVGNGFLPFEFPAHFEMDSVAVNPDTLDVFFLGNQLWIAEGAGPFVYSSIAVLPQLDLSAMCPKLTSNRTSKITDCSFNHPDKTYICMSENQRLLLAGKLGSQYSPSVIRVDEIEELMKAQKVNPWVLDYFCDLVHDRSVFVAGYSGRLLFWYLHEPQLESNALGAVISSDCTKLENEPMLCNNIKQWKKDACTAEPLGRTGFRMVAIDASQLKPMKRNTDAPLVPFIIDASSAVVFEGLVPRKKDDEKTNYMHLSEVHLGQKIFCMNYEFKRDDAKDVTHRHTCELFIRHIKPLEKYLDGFKSSVYVMISKSIPLLPLPSDVVVLAQAQSNTVLVKTNDYINDPQWEFTDDHIGQTLFIPGNFSVLLSGFPIENDTTVMDGYATRHFQFEQRYAFGAFYTFLLDLSTAKYREAQVNQANERINLTKIRWAETDNTTTEELNAENKRRNQIELQWNASDFSRDEQGDLTPVFKTPLGPVVSRQIIEKELLKIRQEEKTKVNSNPDKWTPRKPPDQAELVRGQIDYKDRRIWHVLEFQCHFVMSLVSNPVLKTTGGRISLDIYDRISFEILLTPLTSLAKMLMVRPMLEITNSNPEVLRVEKAEKLKGSPQFFQILLAPTGFKKGVAVITVRSLVTSVHCAHTSSFTLIVLCHRDVGRRLHANYPIPSCKPKEEEGMYPRPWYSQIKGCIESAEILDPSNEEIVRTINKREVTAYITLPTNYRPPSYDGADVPITRNIYNADPSKPAFNTWYKISRQTIDPNRCSGKKTKGECKCSDQDRLMDDEELTECKEKVFATKRTGTEKPIMMSFTYDRIMRDSDQNPEIFLPKRNWSVTIEEVNGRGEWYITHDYTPYLKMINSNIKLHRGRMYYDMNKFYVTLLGTGLFHFKVKLGNFESFGDVTGYFMMYARTDDINHIHLFMILLGTIIFCMTMVFIGFLANRKRLSSMLPIQPVSHKRKLKLL